MAKAAKKNLPDDEKLVPIKPEPETLPPDPPPQQETMFESPQSEAEAESEEAPEQPPDQPQRNKGGRPRKDDPPPPSIIDRIRSYPSWEGRTVYVYRKEPITNRKVGDNTVTHVKKYERAIDEQDLLEDLGSGVYQVRVIYEDPGKPGDRKQIAKADVRCFNMEYPPRIPKIEGMWEDSRNKEWMWAKDLLEQKDAAVIAKQVVQDSSTALFGPLLEMMKEQLESTREELRAVRDNMNRRDPAQENMQTSLMLKMLEKAMTPPPPPPPPPADPVRDLLMQYLMRQLEHKNETPAAAPPPDPIAILDRQLDLQKKIDEAAAARNPGNARSRKSGTQEMWVEIAEHAAPVLQPFAQVIAMGMMQQAQRNAQQQPHVQQQPQQPQTAPPAAELPPPPPPAPVAEQPQPGPQIVQPKVPLMDVIARAAANHIEEGKTGYQFGDWYLETYGEKEFSEAREKGKKRLLDDLRAVPGTSSFLAMHPKELDELVSEFIKWEPADEDDEETTPDPVINEIWQNTQQEIGVKS